MHPPSQIWQDNPHLQKDQPIDLNVSWPGHWYKSHYISLHFPLHTHWFIKITWWLCISAGDHLFLGFTLLSWYWYKLSVLLWAVNTGQTRPDWQFQQLTSANQDRSCQKIKIDHIGLCGKLKWLNFSFICLVITHSLFL